MSESKEQNKITCSGEDSENVRQYSKHFNIDLTPDLIKAIDTFEQDPTFDNQKEFKLQIAKWMMESKHESFTDTLWDAPKKASADAVFDLQFDKDVKEVLTTEGEKKS